MPSSTDKLTRVWDLLEQGLLDRQATGTATMQEVAMAAMLPLVKQIFAGLSPDELDASLATALGAAGGFLSDGTPSLLVVPGRGAWWCRVDPLELADDTGCVHTDLEGRAGDPAVTVEAIVAAVGLALPVPDPVRGDDRDR